MPFVAAIVAMASASFAALALQSTASRPAGSPEAATQPAGQQTQVPNQEELERRFSDLLENVVFRGTFSMTGPEGLKGQAPLSKPRPERYAIEKAQKQQGDRWLIFARVQFMEKDVRLPVPVRVVWAGDTPVITLDKMNLPMLGTYSARVVLHEGFYAGTWSGAGYGGVLSGQIIKAADEEKVIELEKNREGGTPSSQPAEPAGSED